jgi:Arc/MetJ family transcription regulator
VTDPQEDPVTDLATPSRSQIRIELGVDAELLLEAQRQIGAASPDAAVGEALRRLVDQEREKRRAALEKLHRMNDEGRFDYHELDAAEE